MYLEVSSTCIFFVCSYEANLAALLLKQKGVLKQKYHCVSTSLTDIHLLTKERDLNTSKAHFLIKEMENKIKFKKPQSSASHYDIHAKFIIKKDAHLCKGDLKYPQVTGAKTK